MATSPLDEIQQRLTALERTVDQLVRNQPSQRTKDWRRTLGMFTGDELMRKVNEEALRIREADREAARNDPHYFEDVTP